MATVEHVEEQLREIVNRQDRFMAAMVSEDIPEMVAVYSEEIIQHMYALSDTIENEEYRTMLIEGALTSKMALNSYEAILDN